MTLDLRELYQETILDHNKRPRNRRALPSAARRVEGHNPLCGDSVTVYVDTEGDRIRDLAFEGAGCAISTASASLMTEAVRGRTVAEAERIFRQFQEMVTGGAAEEGYPELGDLEVLAGVREYPVRIKCATLAWHALHEALVGGTTKVTTE